MNDLTMGHLDSSMCVSAMLLPGAKLEPLQPMPAAAVGNPYDNPTGRPLQTEVRTLAMTMLPGSGTTGAA